MPKKKKKIKKYLIVIGVLGIFISTIWFYLTIFEHHEPLITTDLSDEWLGLETDIKIRVGDDQTGLKQVWIGIVTSDKEYELINKHYPSKSLFRGSEKLSDDFTVSAEPIKRGIPEGEALFRIKAWDFSWRNWGKGNLIVFDHPISIDTTPPSIIVISQSHNLNQGGSGLVLYRLSEDCLIHGIQVGDSFYPGVKGCSGRDEVYSSFIALGFEQGPDTILFAKAIDRAGNEINHTFQYHINARNFKADRLRITDTFLQRILPEFQRDVQLNPASSLKDRFLMINRKLRKENTQQILSYCSGSDTTRHWQDAFIRLPRSAPKADFADHREYVYQGVTIDHQIHLGVDLASIAHSPVPAANAGRIVFTGRIGIYGNTVIVDHGCDLYSMYSHLSQYMVNKGDYIKRGDPIGKTGMTGLAGGDHLHFGMIVHNTFVNPREWWDYKWIQNNITSKFNELELSY